MTTPTLDLSNILPRSVVLQPIPNAQVARVMQDFRDPRVSDPVYRVWIPPGVTTIRVTTDSRLAFTAKYLRGSTTLELGVLTRLKGEKFEIATESGTEMWLEYAGTANTSDRDNTRIGVRIQPMGKA